VLRIVRVPVALLHPRLAAVSGAKEAGLLSLSGDRRIDDVGILRRQREGDAAEVHRRETLYELVEGCAAVGRLEDATFRAAGDEHAGVTTALIRRRVHDVGIPRIEHDVADSRVLADLEHGLPRAAAVRRLVQPAIAAR